MLSPAEQETKADEDRLGMEKILQTLIRDALRDAPEIRSLALGDAQGLPIIHAVRGGVPVMTFTAMSTMSLRAAMKAAEAVELDEPDHIIVHTRGGDLVIVNLTTVRASLVGLLAPDANLGLALTVLRRLGGRLAEALED
jgi:predicted regulator of Ras-like GTPase activity (Roadblock/LC7/MglB family)